MAYQPMYATVSDNQGYVRGTSCLRGRVDSVGVWVNSLLGTVFKASARFIDCPHPDLRTIQKDRREAVIQECFYRRKVVIDIELEPNEHFDFRINGIDIPHKRLKAIREWDMKKFDVQIKRMEKMRDEGKMGQMMELAQLITK